MHRDKRPHPQTTGPRSLEPTSEPKYPRKSGSSGRNARRESQAASDICLWAEGVRAAEAENALHHLHALSSDQTRGLEELSKRLVSRLIAPAVNSDDEEEDVLLGMFGLTDGCQEAGPCAPRLAEEAEQVVAGGVQAPSNPTPSRPEDEKP